MSDDDYWYVDQPDPYFHYWNTSTNKKQPKMNAEEIVKRIVKEFAGIDKQDLETTLEKNIAKVLEKEGYLWQDENGIYRSF